MLIQYAFGQIGLETIFADAVHRNLRSRHVLEKIEFLHTHDDELLSYYKFKKPKAESRMEGTELESYNW